MRNIKLALRNLSGNKGFLAINIAGLAAGIMCTITLFLYVADELSYDQYNENKSDIFRVGVRLNLSGKESVNAKSAFPTAPALKKDFPEVQEYARIGSSRPRLFRFGDRVFREGKIYMVDPSWFSVFTLPFLYGNPQDALTRPNTVVLTETISKKYFGNENPVGRSFSVDGKERWQITGVMKDFPGNAHFSCNILVPFPRSLHKDQEQQWFDVSYMTYVVLKTGTNIGDLERKLEKKINEYIAPEVEKMLGISLRAAQSTGNSYNLFLQPLTSIYLSSQRNYGIDPNTEWSDSKNGDITYVIVFSAVAVFVLLIAIINFMNLSTANAVRNAKEVGVRKTLGAQRSTLIFRFMTDAVIITVISVALSILLLQAIVLPHFNAFTGKSLMIDLFDNFYALPVLLVFTLVVSALAGSYPAFYLSSFKPIQVLKDGVSRRKATLRRVLVITQFTISTILIISIITIKKQVNYLQNKDLGLDKEHLVSITNAVMIKGKEKLFKESLLTNPSIKAVTNESLMFTSGIPGSGYLLDKVTGDDPWLFQFLEVDKDFLKTFNIGLKEGRFFSEKFPTDSEAVVINEAAARELNIKDPLNHKLTRIGSKTYRIIGVTKDFNYESLHQKIKPLALHLSYVTQPERSVITIRISSGAPFATMKHVEETWKKLSSGEKLNVSFLDEHLNRMYDADKKTGIIILIFSVLAIFIALLGLLGLTAFITEQKTKEIGIRKVLGASVINILIYISREFLYLIVISNCIAWPLAWLVMNQWLQGFAYRVELNIWVFLISGTAIILFAIITICFQSLKAALLRPVISLRSE